MSDLLTTTWTYHHKTFKNKFHGVLWTESSPSALRKLIFILFCDEWQPTFAFGDGKNIKNSRRYALEHE